MNVDTVVLSIGQASERWRQPMSEAEARATTERIRTATRYVCLLLLEVHERRGWLALGYGNWEQYVQTEFGISRSRSYELLDQAKVIEAVRDASGVDSIPDVSAYAALQIKPRLPEVRESIRRRIAASPDADVTRLVAEVVAEHRRQAMEGRRLVRARRGRHAQIEMDGLTHFVEAIDVLASMPAPEHADALLEHVEPPQIESVEFALRWLNDFLAEWKRKRRLALAQGS